MFICRSKYKLNTFLRYLSVPIVASRNECLQSVPNLKGTRFFTNEATNAFVKEMVADVYVREYIDLLATKYQNGDLKDSNITQDTDFNSLCVILDERIQKLNDIQNLYELVKNDVEMKSLAKEEECLYKENLKELDAQLLCTILKGYAVPDNTDVTIEIKAGVGGSEATLFVSDLCNMYIGHIKYLDLTYELTDSDRVEQGGYRHVTLLVSGNKPFEKLRYEGGVHRVQRIPVTEKTGRVHTSTASVAVIPDMSNEEVQLHNADLKIETKRASGAGGQHVNCTDSAVRILHIPTGISVTCQTNRSQIKNKEVALRKLRNILFEQALEKQTTLRSKLRKKQLGFGMRNEKIRTYNFQQDRITDHRLENGSIHNIRDFLQGGKPLEELECRLSKHMQKELLLDIIKQTKYQKS